jgi:hypothetical protein
MKHNVERGVRHLSTHEEIAERAKQIFLERGSTPGHEVDDWLQAEYELMQLPVSKIAEIAPSQVNKGRIGRSALVSLVQLGLFLGTSGITQFRK